MKIGVLFPGQGAQKVGMGLSILEKAPHLERFLVEASDLVSWDLRLLIENGPKEVLDRTDKCQVAILVVSWISFNYLREQLDSSGIIHAAAGLSLGEYGALLAGEVFDFSTAVRLVDIRGRLMQEASERIPSGMSAVIGLEEEKIRQACEGLEVYLANFNTPGQIVISGKLTDLEKAEERLRGFGAKRVVRLAVSGAFHSPLMNESQERLNEEIEKIEFRDPRLTVVSSITGEKITSGEQAKDLLKRQLITPTLWEKCIFSMAQEVDEFWELEPSGVLRTMVRKICGKGVKTL